MAKPISSPNNYNQSKHLPSWSKQPHPVFASFVVMKSITIQPLANANLVRKQWQLHLDGSRIWVVVMWSASNQNDALSATEDSQTEEIGQKTRLGSLLSAGNGGCSLSLCSSGSWWFHVWQSAIENATCKCKAIFFCRQIIRPSFFKNLQGPFPLLSLLASGDGGIKHYEVLLNSPSR